MMKFVVALLVVILFPFFSADAMCGGGHFYKPGFTLEDREANFFIHHDGTTETFVFETSFSGKASDFGLVLATPAKPEIAEVAGDFFERLKKMTTPESPPRISIGEGSSLSPGATASSDVTVIEQKDVGDFSTTLLAASSVDGLKKWLTSNGYQYKPSDERNFEYYISKKTYFFVALKVNLEKVTTEKNGKLSAQLKPISLTFAAPKPMIPLRMMAADEQPESVTLFLSTPEYYYIPGVDIYYARKLKADDLTQMPEFSAFHAQDQWIERMALRISPRTIYQDLIISWVHEPKEITKEGERASFDYLAVPFESGIIPSNAYPPQYEALKDKPVGGVDYVSSDDLRKIPVARFGFVDDSTYGNTDGDFIPAARETVFGTDPKKLDSDNDGYDDLTEILSGNNPLGTGGAGISESFANEKKGMVLASKAPDGIMYVWYVDGASGKRLFLGSLYSTYYDLASMKKAGFSMTLAHMTQLVQAIEKKTNVKKGKNQFWGMTVKKGEKVGSLKFDLNEMSRYIFSGTVTLSGSISDELMYDSDRERGMIVLLDAPSQAFLPSLFMGSKSRADYKKVFIDLSNAKGTAARLRNVKIQKQLVEKYNKRINMSAREGDAVNGKPIARVQLVVDQFTLYDQNSLNTTNLAKVIKMTYVD